MHLTNDKLLHLSRCAIAAAHEAGAFIGNYDRSNLEVNKKNAGENLASQVVTEVDFGSQKIILQHLLPTCTTYDIALLSEESTDNKERLVKDYFWCIDPLDGTLPFIENQPGYAVSIALVSKIGIPIIGVIYNPVTQTIYHAIKGMGSFKNGKQFTIAQLPATGNKFTFCTDRAFVKKPDFPAIVEQLEHMAADFHKSQLEVIKHGGGAMNACWVFENDPACYFKWPKNEIGGGCLWDFAASACIITEAHGHVSDIHGNALDLNRSDSCYMNHRGVLYASNKGIANKIIEMHKQFSI